MKFRASDSQGQRGSVLIIVIWVAFGLVAVTLYFGASMAFELRASDNRVAALQADLAIEGAARYASNLIATVEVPGQLPDLTPDQCEDVAVGDARFWFIGRAATQTTPDLPTFGLVDEASKLNLNTATRAMLEALPNMTAEIAGAIIDWRDTDSNPTSNGAEDETYLRLTPARKCKNAPFESVEELRLVSGMTTELLYGEDSNLNGILDPNENDGDFSAPTDNRDGKLDAGLLAYFTVSSREPMTGRTNVNSPQISALLQNRFGQSRATELLRNAGAAGGGPGGGGGGPGGGATTFGSVLEFYIRSKMTSDELDQVYSQLSSTNTATVDGLINVNTASEAVLACVPGIGTDGAASLVGARLSNGGKLTSPAWVVDVLGQEKAIQAGPYLTTLSFQFTADIAAVGRNDRGFRRAKFIFDTSEGTPKLLRRQDLTQLGWALGVQVRQDMKLGRDSRTLASTGNRTMTK